MSARNTPSSVAQIITFGKMARAPRPATRRVLGFDYATGDLGARPSRSWSRSWSRSSRRCLCSGQELKLPIIEPDAKKILDVAQGLEGIIRNNSIHAAAVIADRPCTIHLQLAEDKSAAATNGSGKPERQAEIEPVRSTR